MINELTGTIISIKNQEIALSLGPIGFELMVPDSSVLTVGQQKKLYVAWHWNTEQGPALYGFISEMDKTIFLLLISCSGIGPKIGLAVIADLGVQRFIHAIQTGDEKALSSVSGIGAKKAEQLMVQLKHKVAQLLEKGVIIEDDENATHWQTVSQALLALNYSRAEVNQAIAHVRGSKQNSASFDQLLRSALSFLSKQA